MTWEGGAEGGGMRELPRVWFEAGVCAKGV